MQGYSVNQSYARLSQFQPSGVGFRASGSPDRATRPSGFARPLTADNLPPLDKCSCLYIALVFCGAGFLLPYNSFITAVDYYQAKFPGTTIVFDMSMTYICVAFVGVLISNFFVELFTLHTRITFGYCLSFSMLLVVAVFDIWMDLFSKSASHVVTLVAVSAVALGCTIQQSSFYGYAGMLPPRYTQAVMTGESAAGLIVSMNRILTKALMPDNPKANTIIFFVISITMVVFCCVIFHSSRRTEFVKYYVDMCKNAGIADDQRGITAVVNNPEEVDILDGNVTRDSYGVLVLQSPGSPRGDGVPLHHEANGEHTVRFGPGSGNQSPTAAVNHNASLHLSPQPGHSYKRHFSSWDAIKKGCRSRLRVARTVWPFMFSIALAYFVTLCLFPGIESEVSSCRLGNWMPVIIFAVFNGFDFIGKIVASIPYDWPEGRLVLCTFCRVVFIPLLMLCAAPRDKPLLTGELWAIFFSLGLGITNGYFGSVPMILAPGKVPDEDKELTGNIMTLSYILGLAGGSSVAYALDSLVGPPLDINPCLPSNASMLLGHNMSVLHNMYDVPPTDLFPG